MLNPIAVVAGVLIAPPRDLLIDGIPSTGLRPILMAQRPNGKAYEGYWEFPGGKVEVNETLQEALQRELYEELGVRCVELTPWRSVQHRYPHAFFEVHIFFCQKWTGKPFGREGQILSWQNPIEVTPVLPATLPLLLELLIAINALS